MTLDETLDKAIEFWCNEAKQAGYTVLMVEREWNNPTYYDEPMPGYWEVSITLDGVSIEEAVKFDFDNVLTKWFAEEEHKHPLFIEQVNISYTGTWHMDKGKKVVFNYGE